MDVTLPRPEAQRPLANDQRPTTAAAIDCPPVTHYLLTHSPIRSGPTVTSRSVLGILAVACLGACGGHSGGAVPGAVPPASSASGAVKEFMAGVADSNIVRI